MVDSTFSHQRLPGSSVPVIMRRIGVGVGVGVGTGIGIVREGRVGRVGWDREAEEG